MVIEFVYRINRNVGKPNFSDQFKKTIQPLKKKKLDIRWISCDSLAKIRYQ